MTKGVEQSFRKHTIVKFIYFKNYDRQTSLAFDGLCRKKKEYNKCKIPC